MELIDKIQDFDFVLASKSPRRQHIFDSLGIKHSVRTKEVDESFPMTLQAEEIPMYLARKKAEAQLSELKEKEVLITADTVVWINDHVLNKPETMEEAKQMLEEISGATHHVYTGVCLSGLGKSHAFAEGTEVHFHSLTNKEIDYYLNRYQPLDKAGAYGIQEFIGYIGIKQVIGDFYNVVGFPVQRFWKELDRFLAD